MATAIRSMLAPWMGGASVDMTTPATVAYRGLFALWVGGGSSGGGTPPAPTVSEWIIKARRRRGR